MTDLPAEHIAEDWYLDIVSARIQTWLSRTPTLRYRRGASTALALATGKASFAALADKQSWLSEEKVRWNEQAGEVSGVVSLVLPGTLTPDLAEALAHRVASSVAKDIHARIPACPLAAALGRGPSYLEAYEAKEARVLMGDLILDLPGSPDESPVSLPCEMCGARAVVYPECKVFGDVVHALCQDCEARRACAGFSSAQDIEQLPQSQRILYQGLIERVGPDVLDFPDDFTELAKRGIQADDDAATQLALVYADGNRIGDVIHGLIDAQAGSKQARGLVKADIAAAIDGATKGAIVDAVEGTFVSGVWKSRPPVVVHVAAGDDIFVSVPASAGWTFLRLLSRAFTQRVRCALAQRATTEVGNPDTWDHVVTSFVERPFTLSAGLVFHHASEPFADVVERAEIRIAAAKRFTAGRHSSVSFLDMTADGGEPVGDREWTLDEGAGSLDGKAQQLSRIASLPASHRNQLLGLLRDIAETTSEGARCLLVKALARRVVTLGHEAIWEVVCDGLEVTADAVEQQLAGAGSQQTRDRLRRYLDTARWWPPTLADADPGQLSNAALVQEDGHA